MEGEKKEGKRADDIRKHQKSDEDIDEGFIAASAYHLGPPEFAYR